MERGEILPGQAVFLEAAHLVVLDQHIGLQGKLAHQPASIIGSEVDGYRALATIGAEEVGRLAGHAAVAILEIWRTPAARVIATFGPLDFDHLRTQIREQLRRPGTCENAAQVENLDSSQRAHASYATGSRARAISRHRQHATW